MPYNNDIEKKIDDSIRRWKNIDKKKMFGGICYLLNGNMCFGIYKDYLIVRAGEEIALERLKEKYVRPFDITGKPMKGWVMVGQKGFDADTALNKWLQAGKRLASSLPPK